MSNFELVRSPRSTALMTVVVLLALAFSGFRPAAQPVRRSRSRPAVAGLFEKYRAMINDQFTPPPPAVVPPAAAESYDPTTWVLPSDSSRQSLPACIARGVPLTGDTLAAALKMRCDTSGASYPQAG